MASLPLAVCRSPAPRLRPGSGHCPTMPPSDSPHALWFATEVQPHEASLRAWLQSRLHNPHDVDDLIQETFVRVLALRERDPERVHATRSLLFMIARNLAVDQVRRRERRPTETLSDEPDDALVEEGPSTSESVSRSQELELLTQALQELPDRCRQVLTLRKIYGLPQREIARRLGIAEHTVEAHVGLGMRRCAAFLARFGLP